MTKFLLSVHVLAAIVAIGPVTVAASMFPSAARAALARPGDEHSAGIARVLYRICGIYSALGLLVVVFGFFTAQSLDVLGQTWLMVAIALTGLAALVLAFAILPAQRNLIDEITAAAAARVAGAGAGTGAGKAEASPGGAPAGAVSAMDLPTADQPTTSLPASRVAAALDSGAATGNGFALARTKRLAMTAGIFNLLWATVTVLMIIRPGSTTGV
ncbi:protease [Frankia sp. AiPs1]|uniref:protease n=1 Tax=Frankia sp. AiPs1 TaxID=573493 RepID=UPI002043969E|nr:protease [Frankia sp. AiPs1]MCM3920559.1 protease [Frankia sp. AiPs1]